MVRGLYLDPGVVKRRKWSLLEVKQDKEAWVPSSILPRAPTAQGVP